MENPNRSTQDICTEIALFTLKPGLGEAYREFRRAMDQFLRRQPGFLAWQTLKSEKLPGSLVRIVQWTDPDSAYAAEALFQDSPEAGDFMALVDEMRVREHFTPLETQIPVTH